MARYRRNHTEKKHALYALVDPVSPPPKPVLITMTGKSGYRFSEYGHAQFERALVEAPGTAPGSEWFISTAIYFHSRRTGAPNIRSKCREGQWLIGRTFPAKGGKTGDHTPNWVGRSLSCVLNLGNVPGVPVRRRSRAGSCRIDQAPSARRDRAVPRL